VIVASILLILVAVALLVAGLAGGSSALLITAIAASLLATVALVARARQALATQATADRLAGPRDRTPTGPSVPGLGEPDIPVQHIPSTVGTGGSGWRQPPEPPVTDPYAPAPTSPATDGPYDGDPPAQRVPAAELARLARLDAEVRVVEGHRRFHLPACPHLVGRSDTPLPVAEAVRLGFTPCARCAPATALLADARPAGS
jgi:hypothetical protein